MVVLYKILDSASSLPIIGRPSSKLICRRYWNTLFLFGKSLTLPCPPPAALFLCIISPFLSNTLSYIPTTLLVKPKKKKKAANKPYTLYLPNPLKISRGILSANGSMLSCSLHPMPPTPLDLVSSGFSM